MNLVTKLRAMVHLTNAKNTIQKKLEMDACEGFQYSLIHIDCYACETRELIREWLRAEGLGVKDEWVEEKDKHFNESENVHYLRVMW